MSDGGGEDKYYLTPPQYDLDSKQLSGLCREKTSCGEGGLITM